MGLFQSKSPSTPKNDQLSPLDSRIYRVSSPSIPPQFSVVSYNVLADCYFSDRHYPYCKPGHRNMADRHPKIVAELTSLQGQIVCLQEVEKAHFDLLTSSLPSFEGTFLPKTGQGEGVATFYDREHFDLIETHLIELDRLCEAACKEVDARPSTAIQNIASLVTVLRHKETGNSVAVCNVHLYWYWKRPDVQSLHVALLFRHLAEILPSDMPLVICGDYNLQPDTLPFKLAMQGQLSDQDVESMGRPSSPIHPLRSRVCHPLSLASSYELVHGSHPTFTNHTGREKFVGTLDHILFHKDRGLKPVTVLGMPPETVIPRMTGCPNAVFPSDHLSMLTGFVFT